MEALALIDSDEARDRIKSYLKEETNKHNLTIGLVAAARNSLPGDGDLSSILFDFLTFECDKVRTGAVKALEYVISREELPRLTPGLADPSSDVRAATVIAIWKQGEFSICDSLKTMLDSGDGLTCRSAATVVTEIGRLLRNLEHEPNTEALLEALKKHDFYRRN